MFTDIPFCVKVFIRTALFSLIGFTIKCCTLGLGIKSIRENCLPNE